MTEMHRFTAWSSSCVEEELVPLLELVQDCVEVSVGEKHSSPEQMMSRFLDQGFKPSQESGVYGRTTKFNNQLLVVYSLVRAGLDVPGVYLILISFS